MGTTSVGRAGESLALAYLTKKGYRLVKRNFRRLRGEIDLIMEDGDTLVFVEVKTRSNERYGAPIEAVTPYKQQHIRYAAKAFLYYHHIEDRRIRYDVVEVKLLPDGSAKFRHTKNAF